MLTFTAGNKKEGGSYFRKRVAIKTMVKKEIMYHTNFQTKDELFEGVTAFLVENDLATAEIEVALKEREEKFPTGLPTIPASAIPHTDGTYAKDDVILCVLNETPLDFYQMGSNKEQVVEAQVIFVLMMRDIVTHLDQLQHIIEKVRNTNFVAELVKADEATFTSLVKDQL